jgi:chorismate mutase
VSQKAMDLNMDGLMVEVHTDPSNALSDCNQQITPLQYKELIERLVIRKPGFDDPGFMNDLEELRNQVDSIDHQFVELLGERMKIIDKIAEYKFSNNVSVLQMERWLEILKTRTEHGNRIGLETKFMEQLLKQLHQESIRRQTDVMIEKKKAANGLSDKSVTD